MIRDPRGSSGQSAKSYARKDVRIVACQQQISKKQYDILVLYRTCRFSTQTQELTQGATARTLTRNKGPPIFEGNWVERAA
jgi:hypothetical protein